MIPRITTPKHLSDESKGLYRQIVREYNIDDPAGLSILKVAFEAFDRAEAARKAIEDEGMQVKDRFDVMKAHPLIGPERDARGQFLTALKAMNLDLEPLHDKPGRPPGS